jgi:hypothetical protein
MKCTNSTENEPINLQMKNAVFWDVALCEVPSKRRFTQDIHGATSDT